MSITLTITGASGAQYGLRLLQQLLLSEEKVYLLISKAGLLVINSETPLRLSNRPKEIQARLLDYFQIPQADNLQVLGLEEWTAPIASGSGVSRAMVVCPCTSGTMAAIATGLSRNLIERAADVILKEQRRLILVHRETPLSKIHLENMLRLANNGALILPANPGFYYNPTTITEVIDFIVARILDHLEISHQLQPVWGSI